MAWAICLGGGEPGKVVVGMGRLIWESDSGDRGGSIGGVPTARAASARFKALRRWCEPGRWGWVAGRRIRE